jgi:ABC-type glycerol-3-phosphate transport system substrate-binding protein
MRKRLSLLLLSLVLLAGCSAATAKPAHQIVGNWKVNGKDDTIWTFRTNGILAFTTVATKKTDLIPYQLSADEKTIFLTFAGQQRQIVVKWRNPNTFSVAGPIVGHAPTILFFHRSLVSEAL